MPVTTYPINGKGENEYCVDEIIQYTDDVDYQKSSPTIFETNFEQKLFGINEQTEKD